MRTALPAPPGSRGALGSHIPTWESIPVSSARWMPSWSSRPLLQAMPRPPGASSDLRDQILPLADPQVVQVLLSARPAQTVRRGATAHLPDVLPQVEQGVEVRAPVREPGVRGVGPAPLRLGSLPRVLDRQAATMTTTSRTHPVPAAARTIRPRRGSSGSSGQLPTQRGEPGRSTTVLEGAELVQECHAVADLRESGGSRNGNRSISPSRSAVICRMTDARLVRRISGSVNAGRSGGPAPSRAGWRCRPRRVRTGRHAGWPTPGRSARSAAAAP